MHRSVREPVTHNCEEPINFAFIQRNGVPTGPPSPQDADTSTYVNNSETLLMNPGDKITFHMSDAPAPGGGDAFEVVMDDLTTHQSGFMQASAANGFQTTSMADCSGTPFNFQPEYNTAKAGNINPWGADQVNISTEFETGHWEACTSLSDPISQPDRPERRAARCTTSATARTRTPARPTPTRPRSATRSASTPAPPTRAMTGSARRHSRTR